MLLSCTTKMSQQISPEAAFFTELLYSENVCLLCFLLPAHHVQAATVHQGSELMKTDLSGVQYSLDLFQTSLEMNEEKRKQKKKNT